VYAVLPIAILWAATELPDAGRRLNARDPHLESSATTRDTPTAVPGGSNGGRVAELERLALLHDSGSLTDAEFAGEKAVVMNGS
jgi:hypothetical protein